MYEKSSTLDYTFHLLSSQNIKIKILEKNIL